MYNLLVGADPELFAKKRGHYVSAHGLVPGTKAEPHVVDRGAVQVDGMALEFNIDPAKNKKEFITNLNVVMGILGDMLPKHEVVAEPVAHFSKYVMDRQCEAALELGCEPDYDAYKAAVNPAPNGDVKFRSAAGHVHIGWCEGVDPHDPGHFDACCMYAKELDVHLALASVEYDQNFERRQLYGQIGAFRPKSYGMEYRVLSNGWLKSDALKGWVYDGIHNAWDRLMDGKPTYPDVGLAIARMAKTKHRDPPQVVRAMIDTAVQYLEYYKVARIPRQERNYV